MYDPTLGRFINVDPIGFEAGDANLYRYVGNGVTYATDPTGLLERLENSPPQPHEKPLEFDATWRFRLSEPAECDVVLIQRVQVNGNKTGSKAASTNYWEVAGVIPAGEVEGPHIDKWAYPGESTDVTHATLTMRGHIYAYELTPTLKNLIEDKDKWKPHQQYTFGDTFWTSGDFPSSEKFNYSKTKDAHLVEEEEVTTILNIDYKPKKGNVITVSASKQ